MLRRLIAAVLCAGLLAGAAATAEAARNYKAGTYKGKTEQGAKISLKVIKSKKALIKFYWEGAVMQCSDGQNRQIAGGTSPASIRFPIKKSGRFSITGGNQDETINFAIVGKLKGKRASGALQVQASSTDEATGEQLTCDSEIVEWKAKRK
jgi:hypothetical protein